MRKKNEQILNNIGIDEALPHQIEAPSFKDSGMKLEPPFLNSYGVIIGDSAYASDNSPLENWSDEVDPAIMSGDEWVHPTNDIGWNTSENKKLLESKKSSQSAPFSHPNHDVSQDID